MADGENEPQPPSDAGDEDDFGDDLGDSQEVRRCVPRLTCSLRSSARPRPPRDC